MTTPNANPLRDALAPGRFSYMVELVASARTSEEQLAEIGGELAAIPGIVAAGVTSFAGGSEGHDPSTVSKIVAARGLTPNVHVTCVSNPRDEAIARLEDLHRSGIHNIFAITGDHPQAGQLRKKDLAPLSGYDLDSVQMVELLSEFRRAGYPFLTSVAVSPFKYTEADCVYQYLKLEKKIAAGADFAITQLGYDSRKFRELKRYLAEHGLPDFPVFGNVYILNAPGSRKFAKGEPPGCWASQELVDRIKQDVKETDDNGMARRLERAAKMVAIVRGLGYTGAYIGGDHDGKRIRWVIERAEEIKDNWEEYAEEISYGPDGSLAALKQGQKPVTQAPPAPPKEDKAAEAAAPTVDPVPFPPFPATAFYMYEAPEPPARPLPGKVQLFDILNNIALAHEPGLRRSLGRGLMKLFDSTKASADALEKIEFAFKENTFGCQACGNCVLGEMEYVCPMTCPKNLRNGPCGGPLNGMCEVTPEQPCIWVEVYHRAKSRGTLDELKTYIPPRVRELAGTSSYINFYLDKDARPEHFQPLVQIGGLNASSKAR